MAVVVNWRAVCCGVFLRVASAFRVPLCFCDTLFSARSDAVGHLLTDLPWAAFSPLAPAAGIEDYQSKIDSLDPDTVYTLSGVEVYVPDSADHDTSQLRAALAAARVIKTPGEIEMLRAAAEISAESHKLLMRHIRCGAYESDAESLFSYVDHHYGARVQAYIPIVGGGANSAALREWAHARGGGCARAWCARTWEREVCDVCRLLIVHDCGIVVWAVASARVPCRVFAR